MKLLSRWLLLAVLVLSPFVRIPTQAIAAGGPCVLSVTGFDANSFPNVALVVRAQEPTGQAVRGLENDLRLTEKTELDESGLIQPSVTRDDTAPHPLAVSLIVDVRNGATIEELTVIREFAMKVVDSLNASTPLDSANASQIALWAPSLNETNPVITWGDGAYLDYASVIKQDILPVFEHSSAGLDALLRQIMLQKSPDDLPHIVIVVGKVQEVNETTDPALLATQAQQANVLIYSAGVLDTDDVFLQKVTNTFYSPASTASAERVMSDIASHYYGVYKLAYASSLTPTAQERQLTVSVIGSHTCASATSIISVSNAIPLPESATQQTRYVFFALGALAILGMLLVFEGNRQIRLLK